MRKLGVIGMVLAWTAATVPAWAAPVDLTILHTNDTHDHLLPYETRQGKDLGGIARRATLITQIKGNTERVLVLDAGDTFQGTPLFNFFSGEPDYLTMDQAGYDATTVGNHDLDNGLENLKKQAAGRRFKLISTNLLDPKTGKPIFVGTHVFERGGLKVGVFGVLGFNALGAVAKENQKDFKFVSPIKVAEETAAELRKRSDLVVMLSHSGLDEDTELAGKVKGIDVIVGGHSHTKLDQPREVMNGDWRTLVVQGFQWGEYVGKLDLKVDGGKVVAYEGKLMPVTKEIADDQTVAATVKAYNDKIAERMAVIIGSAPKGLSAEGKYKKDSELGNWTADVMRERGKAEIGIMNAGGLRAALQPGSITVGDVFTIFPFDNALVTIDVDGATLKGFIDKAAAIPGRAAQLQYSGVTFAVAGGKASDIRVNGTPLDTKRFYKVATIDYLAQGNDGYEAFANGKNYQATGKVLRDVIIEAITARPTLIPPATGRIRVAN
ncbi:bifunctional metallophosphatase/5'-nucleotidase [bacterium]|nr:bifunctional metallophosphatase/5'-nucleotidase [bacterium]